MGDGARTLEEDSAHDVSQTVEVSCSSKRRSRASALSWGCGTDRSVPLHVTRSDTPQDPMGEGVDAHSPFTKASSAVLTAWGASCCTQ